MTGLAATLGRTATTTIYLDREGKGRPRGCAVWCTVSHHAGAVFGGLCVVVGQHTDRMYTKVRLGPALMPTPTCRHQCRHPCNQVFRQKAAIGYPPELQVDWSGSKNTLEPTPCVVVAATRRFRWLIGFLRLSYCLPSPSARGGGADQEGRFWQKDLSTNEAGQLETHPGRL